MDSADQAKAYASLDALGDVVEELTNNVAEGVVTLPPRAIPIIEGATETLHALNMGGWPWNNPVLRAMSE